METSSRRKACDTCYNKKIKCDLAKPVCSNCQLYKVKCTTTVLRRRVVPQSEKPANPPLQETKIPGGQDSLEARLARIESKLDSLGVSGSISLASLFESPSNGSGSSPDLFAGDRCSSESTSIDVPTGLEPLKLPPLQEILPVIEAYFKDFNSVIPLFHQPSLMKMLHDFYSGATKAQRAVWAVINIVLAIGHRVMSIEADPVQYSVSEGKCRECVANVQKVLDSLATRDEDTLGVQVILGLIVIHQASADSRSNSVLMGTAVSLAHRLQLHTKSSHSSFAPYEANQRDNIFWICYFLDKDTSVRAKTPPMQRDIDIDLDLPGTSQQSNEGELRSLDGICRFNYFRARVQLAHLKGRIFDNLYSVRSRKMTPDERRQQVISLDTLVDEWRRTIPVPFQVEQTTQSLARAAVVHMTVLYHHYLLCLVMIHGLFSVESEWVKAMGDAARVTLENFDNNTNICMHHMQPPLPSAWTKCVTASRGSIRLFLADSQNGCCAWLNMSVYFSGLIILLANLQYYPTHELATQDSKLAKDGMKLLAHIVDIQQDRGLKGVLHVLQGLDVIADKSIQHFQANPNQTPASPVHFQGTYSHIPFDLFNTSVGDHAFDDNSHLFGDTPLLPNELTLNPSDLNLLGFDSFNERIQY